MIFIKHKLSTTAELQISYIQENVDLNTTTLLGNMKQFIVFY